MISVLIIVIEYVNGFRKEQIANMKEDTAWWFDTYVKEQISRTKEGIARWIVLAQRVVHKEAVCDCECVCARTHARTHARSEGAEGGRVAHPT